MAIKLINPILKGKVENIPDNSVSVGDLFSSDRAQSRFFTVTIDKFDSNTNNLFENTTVTNKEIEGLPVKNMSYIISGIDSMVLPIGVFKDVPIPTGKRLPKITLTLIDDRMDQIETALRNWCNVMIPSESGIIGYLDDMVGTLIYTSYDTSGDVNFTYQANVILTDDFSMSRDYETNELKAMEISLVVLRDDVKVENKFNRLKKPKPAPETAPNPALAPEQGNNYNQKGPIESNPFNIRTTVQPIFKI